MTEPNFDETEQVEIETPDFESDVEAVEPVSNEDVEVLPTAAETAKATAAPAKAAKPPVPDGYITPVQFAHELTKREREAGRLAEGQVIAPQQIYSYVNQGKKAGANPETTLKSYTEGDRTNLLKRDEAFAYWDGKEQRRQAREAAKTAKATAAPAPEAPVEAEAQTEQVTEVE